jgi:hypothetical protein
MNSICSHGLHNNPLVSELDIHKRSQSVLFVGTHQNEVVGEVSKGGLGVVLGRFNTKYRFENLTTTFDE